MKAIFFLNIVFNCLPVLSMDVMPLIGLPKELRSQWEQHYSFQDIKRLGQVSKSFNAYFDIEFIAASSSFQLKQDLEIDPNKGLQLLCDCAVLLERRYPKLEGDNFVNSSLLHDFLRKYQNCSKAKKLIVSYTTSPMYPVPIILPCDAVDGRKQVVSFFSGSFLKDLDSGEKIAQLYRECLKDSPSFVWIKHLCKVNEKFRAQVKTQSQLFSKQFYPRCDAALTQVLLDNGADPNVVDEGGDTPLHHASWESEKTVEALLNCGANIDVFDKEGNTPLYNAITYKCPKMVKMLCEKGAFLVNEDGKTAFHVVAEKSSKEGSLEMAEMFFANGADVNAVDKDGNTPLFAIAKSSSEEDSLEVIEMFLAKGAEVNAVDKNGDTPLYWAVLMSKNPALVKLLLSNGGKVKKVPCCTNDTVTDVLVLHNEIDSPFKKTAKTWATIGGMAILYGCVAGLIYKYFQESQI